MRLDDLWDPDQRWALLSDTTSKQSRTDPVVFPYQNYFRPARLLAIHVDESARAQQQEVQEYRCRGRRDKPSDVVTCERTDVELALCLSATFVLCDGFRKLGLQNTEVDAMISRDFSRLKKVWERRSHFVPLEGYHNNRSVGSVRRLLRADRDALASLQQVFRTPSCSPEAEDTEKNRRFMQSWGERIQERARSISLRERR
jgi:hypothetical protein